MSFETVRPVRGVDKAAVEGRPLAEVELVRRAKRADVAAYSELVRRYQTLAFRTAYLVTGSAEDAEERAVWLANNRAGVLYRVPAG